jgi:hypothetical protein
MTRICATAVAIGGIQADHNPVTTEAEAADVKATFLNNPAYLGCGQDYFQSSGKLLLVLYWNYPDRQKCEAQSPKNATSFLLLSLPAAMCLTCHIRLVRAVALFHLRRPRSPVRSICRLEHAIRLAWIVRTSNGRHARPQSSQQNA